VRACMMLTAGRAVSGYGQVRQRGEVAIVLMHSSSGECLEGRKVCVSSRLVAAPLVTERGDRLQVM
jgi:hypothetical protein